MDSLVGEDEGSMGRGFMSTDEFEAVDIGDGDKPRLTYVSAKLDLEYKQKLVSLLKGYKDCFAWQYYKMPGLDRKLVEHRLPIKPGYRPFKQAPRRIKHEVMADLKVEITQLYEVKFNRQCRYVEWISSVVPMYKKNGKVRVYIDFRDLNKATPMDNYPMPVTDMLVNAVAGHKVISLWMVMSDIIRYSWQKKIFIKLLLGVLVRWVYMSGWL